MVEEILVMKNPRVPLLLIHRRECPWYEGGVGVKDYLDEIVSVVYSLF
jgi:hypothetical protein